MNRLRWLGALMGIAILGITGFQLYWLKQNYDREEKSLAIRSEISFHEAIQELQVIKLKLQGIGIDTLGGTKKRIFLKEGNDKDIRVMHAPGKEIVSTINIIRSKLKDSLRKRKDINPGMVIAMKKSDTLTDSIRYTTRMTNTSPDDFFQLLYGVDSLQDSLKIEEITSAYTEALKENKLDIPFTVIRADSISEREPQFNEVTVGLANPVTYRLQLGNTFPYVIRQITMPILFSIVLLGITVLSFVLLYRNLLKQQRLAELKNEFISNITHELKTPIATVGVAIEALKNFNAISDPDRTREYLDISSNELQRLNLLVDKVLKLSMFEKKEIELKYESFNLTELVEEVITSLRLQLEKNNVEISAAYSGDLSIQGDRLHLQSVIFNLVDNAIKYAKKDPVISINLEEKGDRVVLRFVDNGIGIPPEYRKKIFEKFFRILHGDTHDAKGYGLGLSYTAHVVRKHGGTIEVISEPGSGSTFIIELPKSAGNGIKTQA